MDTTCIASVEKWVIMSVTLKANGLTQIDIRLPATVSHCKGFLFTITDIQGCFHTLILGEASLFFNTRKSHPLHYLVEWKNCRFGVTDLLVTLDEPVHPGSRISGFFKNYVDNCYTLNLYLLCNAGLTPIN